MYVVRVQGVDPRWYSVISQKIESRNVEEIECGEGRSL